MVHGPVLHIPRLYRRYPCFRWMVLREARTANLAQVLRDCEAKVRDELAFDIRLEEKPITSTDEDNQHLEDDLNLDEMDSLERLIHLLTAAA